MLTLGQVAGVLELESRGDASLPLSGLAPLESAKEDHLSFVSKESYLSQLPHTQAGALILHPDWLESWAGPCLLSTNPYLAFARATHAFDNRPAPSGAVHPRATVDPSVIMAKGVTVDAGAVIGAGVVLEEDVWIGANVYVGEDCSIGARTRINPGVVIYYGVSIGCDCIVHANAVLGADGFGFAPSDQGWIKILQLGGVVIGNRVEIGASSTVDRGALSDTVLADNVIIDDQVHIGHNVRVGARTGIAACSGIGGSTVVGADCTLAGMCGVGDHLEIVDKVHVNGLGRVSRSLTEPGLYASGTPIQPYRDWSKNAVRFEQLAAMAKRLNALEKQLALLNESQNSTEGNSL